MPAPMPKVKARKTSISILPQRNVKQAILGDIRIDTWYPSNYPAELIGKSLFVCPHCFKYTPEAEAFEQHIAVYQKYFCSLKTATPVGNLVYARDNVSLHEVDGSQHKLFAQNLSLFAKLFLETKSVFYHVTTFVYYTLVYHETPKDKPRVVGFFSKEKLSWDNNNLACICVFPPWQKRGLGQLLMAASYELSKDSERLGGPEKPLSEMGRRAYDAYWSATIARYILHMDETTTHPACTVDSISRATGILPEDVASTLQSTKFITNPSNSVIDKRTAAAWLAERKLGSDHPVDALAFIGRLTDSRLSEASPFNNGTDDLDKDYTEINKIDGVSNDSEAEILGNKTEISSTGITGRVRTSRRYGMRKRRHPTG